MKTLLEAQKEFVKQVKDGTKCPCCGRFAKVSRLSITNCMVASLQWIANHSVPAVDEGCEVQDKASKWLLRSRRHTKLMNWDLLEQKENTDTKKKFSGIYRPTPLGLLFLEGKMRVQKHALIYNKKLLALVGT